MKSRRVSSLSGGRGKNLILAWFSATIGFPMDPHKQKESSLPKYTYCGGRVREVAQHHPLDWGASFEHNAGWPPKCKACPAD